MGEHAGDALCQPVIAEVNLFPYGSSRPYGGNLKCTRFRLHGQVYQECHAQGDVEVQGVDGLELPHPETLELEHLLLAAEAFLGAPPGKVELSDADDVFLGTDLLVRSQHHGMIRDAVDQYEVNILPGSSAPYLHMGKVGVMVFALVIKGCFYLPLALVPAAVLPGPTFHGRGASAWQ